MYLKCELVFYQNLNKCHIFNEIYNVDKFEGEKMEHFKCYQKVTKNRCNLTKGIQHKFEKQSVRLKVAM